MKNTISLVSALCLAAALTLTACGGKKQAATPPKTDTPAAIAPGEPSPADPAAATDPAKPAPAPAEQPKGGW